MAAIDLDTHHDNAPVELDAALDFADEVADWLVGEAERHLASHRVDEALRAAHVAASVLVRQNRRLVSARLERLVQEVAAHPLLTALPPAWTFPSRPSGTRICLHVIEEAMGAGGLTAMATRWMSNDNSGTVHCAALLAQRCAVPDVLLAAVRATGGSIWQPPPRATLVERAAWLRHLAASVADYVVLHVGVSDVVFAAAFGKDGGPPVLLVNHAAHIFWVGASIADVVANCRGSALEGEWAKRHRGVRFVTIPIPLGASATELPFHRTDRKLIGKTKIGLGMPESAAVVLTVGAAFKYQSTKRLDFLQSIRRVLERAPSAHLVVAGVEGDERWAAASSMVGGRIHTLGPVDQTTLARLHAISDVYAEGFPFGTTTSLLEAGLRGVPAVLAPANSPPPYGSDGVALDGVLDRPRDAQEFEDQLVALLESAPLRNKLSRKLSSSILEHHIGDGWRAHLRESLKAVPIEHKVTPPWEPAPTGPAVYRHWSEFIDQTSSPYLETLEHAVVRALILGVKPVYSQAILEACLKVAHLRAGCGVPIPVVRFVLNVALPRLPTRIGVKAFRATAFLFRRGLMQRTVAKLFPMNWSHSGKRSWYDAYRGLGR